MDMFSNLFSSFQTPTYSHSQAKVCVTLTRNRVVIQREKKASLQDMARKEIATLLKEGKEATALAKAEALLYEMHRVESFSTIELYLEHIEVRGSDIANSKSPPPELLPAISGLIFCSQKVQLKELQKLVHQWGLLWGPKYIQHCRTGRSEHIDADLITLLSQRKNDAELHELVSSIAAKADIVWGKKGFGDAASLEKLTESTPTTTSPSPSPTLSQPMTTPPSTPPLPVSASPSSSTLLSLTPTTTSDAPISGSLPLFPSVPSTSPSVKSTAPLPTLIHPQVVEVSPVPVPEFSPPSPSLTPPPPAPSPSSIPLDVSLSSLLPDVPTPFFSSPTATTPSSPLGGTATASNVPDVPAIPVFVPLSGDTSTSQSPEDDDPFGGLVLPSVPRFGEKKAGGPVSNNVDIPAPRGHITEAPTPQNSLLSSDSSDLSLPDVPAFDALLPSAPKPAPHFQINRAIAPLKLSPPKEIGDDDLLARLNRLKKS